MAKQPAYKNVGFAQVLDLSDLVGAEVQKKRLRDEQIKKTITDVASIDLSGVREASIEGITAMHQDLFRYVADNAKELNDPISNPNAWKDFMSKKHQLLQSVTLDKQLGAAATDNAKLFAEEEEYGMRAGTNRAIISTQMNTSAVSKGEDGQWTYNPEAASALNLSMYRGADLSAYVLDNVNLSKKELGTDFESLSVGGVSYKDRLTRFGAEYADAQNEVYRMMSSPGGSFALATELESMSPEVMAKLGNPESVSIDTLLSSEDEDIRRVGESVLGSYTQVAMSTVDDELKINTYRGATPDDGGGADKGLKYIDFDKALQGVGFKYNDPQLGDIDVENVSVELPDGRVAVFARKQTRSADKKSGYESFPMFISEKKTDESGNTFYTRDVLSAEDMPGVLGALNGAGYTTLTNEIGGNTAEMGLAMYYENQIAGTTGGKMNKDLYLKEMGFSSFVDLAQSQVNEHIASGKRWDEQGMIATTSGQANISIGGEIADKVSFDRLKPSDSENAFSQKIAKNLLRFVDEETGLVANNAPLPVNIEIQNKMVEFNIVPMSGDSGRSRGLQIVPVGSNDALDGKQFLESTYLKEDGTFDTAEAAKVLTRHLMNSIGRFAAADSRWNPKDVSTTPTNPTGGTAR